MNFYNIDVELKEKWGGWRIAELAEEKYDAREDCDFDDDEVPYFPEAIFLLSTCKIHRFLLYCK